MPHLARGRLSLQSTMRAMFLTCMLGVPTTSCSRIGSRRRWRMRSSCSGLFRKKRAVDQTVMGWRGQNRLMAVVAILRDVPSNGVWYLGFLIVDAAARGKGIGRSIYKTIKRWAVDCRAQEIRLAVLEVNGAAERFWRSQGYKELRRVGPDTFKARSHHRVKLCRLLDGNLPA